MIPEETTLRWDEVESAARRMFDVWVTGSELEWAQDAWMRLETAGLTKAAGTIERTEAALRLVTLAAVYERFCAVAWDENRDTPLEYLSEDLEIDDTALGWLAAKVAPDLVVEAMDEEEFRSEALQTVVTSMRKEIFECLRSSYGGEIALYSRMWHTRRAHKSETDLDEFEVTGPNSMALNYVSNGFQI